MRKYRYVMMSTLVPLFIVGLVALVAYLLAGFGFVSNDCFEQYTPFFSAYYDVLMGHKSMFYSLTGSMGYDFYAVFAYYLVSPLNFLMLLFGKDNIIYVVNVLIILKIGLAGGSFSIFIKNRFPKASTGKIILFSTIYAMSGFTIGYAWNIMWMDGIVIFPLVIAGLDRLMRDDKVTVWYWYTIALTALVVISYFIGYMSCIFLLMYFFTYNFKSVGFFVKKLLITGWASLLALAMSAVILVPSYLALSGTSIEAEKLPKMEFYGSYAQTLQSLILGVPQNGITFDHQYANLFVTMFVLLMACVYFATGTIRLSAKIRQGLLIGVLVFSMNFKPLNYIWHGMHQQTGIPNRFSFMVIFLLLVMAFEVGMQKKGAVRLRSLLIGWGIYTAILAVLAVFRHELIFYAIGSALLGIVYLLILTMVRPAKWKFRLSALLALFEITGMFVFGIYYSSGAVMGNYAYYMDDFKEIRSTLEDGFYREKMDETYNVREEYYENSMEDDYMKDLTLDKMLSGLRYIRNIGHLSVVNEDTVYGLRSLSLFNTFNNYAMTRFYQQTGATGGINNVMYSGENAFMDMLLGVKYYYTRYTKSYSQAYKEVRTVGGVTQYENQYALSVGYLVPDKLLKDDSLLLTNPFKSMNQISVDIAGLDVFVPQYFIMSENNLKKSSTKTYSLTPDQDGELSVQVNSGTGVSPDTITCYVNQKKILTTDRVQMIYDLGKVTTADQVRIVVHYPDKAKTDSSIFAAVAVEGALQKVYDTLKDGQLLVDTYSEDHLSGTIDLKDSGNLLITIPDTKGWKVFVDGKQTTPDQFEDLFMVLKLNAGEHKVTMEYRTPGFDLGAKVTLAAIGVTILAMGITIIRYRHEEDTELI